MYVTDQVRQGAPELPRQPAARRPTQPEPAKCPRCASTNTKFCYYNNYNKSQPRHFCKSCKRHWTKGGSLRNVPVGGARSTKNKRPRITSAASGSNNNNHEHKSVSSILYRALIVGAPEKTDNGATEQFEFSTLSAFETSPLLNPISYHCDLDSVEESTNNNDKSIIPGCSSVPWDTGSRFDSLPNYWNWSHEIEVSDHDLNISWDEMKP